MHHPHLRLKVAMDRNLSKLPRLHKENRKRKQNQSQHLHHHRRHLQSISTKRLLMPFVISLDNRAGTIRFESR